MNTVAMTTKKAKSVKGCVHQEVYGSPLASSAAYAMFWLAGLCDSWGRGYQGICCRRCSSMWLGLSRNNHLQATIFCSYPQLAKVKHQPSYYVVQTST